VPANLVKRFYKDATVAQKDGGYQILLDGNELRTPQRTIVKSSFKAWCAALADEWNAQEETIDPIKMPLTRIMNSALDQVAPHRDHIVDEVAGYATTDQIYHEADQPDALVARQREGWQPLRDWAAQDLDADLTVATGIIAVPQSDHAVAAIRRHVARHDDVKLAALHLSTKVCGSVVIALALSAGRVSAEEAWDLSRIDEAWQVENWGQDEEAASLAESAKADVLACARAFALLG
jgi:chaperone required for assembly of F1-ATPase